MSDMNFMALLGRGRQLLGRMRLDETTDQSAGSFSLLALRLERDLARQGKGNSILVAAADDDATGVESASELAWCLAEDLGHTVLLVDGTFSTPLLTYEVGLAGKAGLIELIDSPAQNAAMLEACVQPSAHKRVSILPHGSERRITLRAEAIRNLLAAACEQYDFVVILGSLLEDSSGSLAFGSMVDAALLIAVEEKSTIDDIARGQRLLNDCGARRVALVLGNRPRTRHASTP